MYRSAQKLTVKNRMVLSEKEKEYFQALAANKLKPIQRRQIEAQQQIDYNFTLDRIHRVELYEKGLKDFLEEKLDVYVQAFIETHKKLKKRVEKSDYSDLVKTLNILVDSSLAHFCEDHRNHPLASHTEDLIVEKKIYILSNTLPSLISDSLLPLSEFICESELLFNEDITDEYERALGFIRTAMIAQSQTPVQLAKHDEDSYRKLIGNALRVNYNGQVTLESLNGKGKTDILLKINNKNVLIVECKIWSKKEDFNSAINQLLGRYLEWHDNKAVLIIFCRNNSLTEMILKIKEITEKHNSYKQTLNCAEENEFRFLFRHPEDSNRNLILSVMAFKIPKNQNLNKISS